MTSDQQVSDFASAVTKTPGLNPNANIFTSSKLVATPAEKDWETREEFLTNGDLKQDEVGGFSSGDSPVSTSPPVQGLDSTSEGPQVLSGGTGLGGSSVAAAYVHMVTADAAGSLPAEEDDSSGPVILPPMQMANGLNSMGHEGASTQGASQERSLSPDRLRTLLKQQLEYYFSRENLVHDQYLQSQMDSDQYVPIATVASFNLVQKLTHDLDLIVEVLRASKQVQVDEKGEKVRPKHSRSVLMLREIPETTPVEEVRALFDGENCPKVVSCEFAHNSYWYITFETDEDATQAYRYLREEKKTFLNKPIMARIKARPLMRTGGPYILGKAVPRQPAPETQSFLRQQTAYPIVTPISPFVSGQQVAQGFYLPPVLQQWGTPAAAAAATFLDPGAMLAMNGYQATSIKPSTNSSRNVYPRNNRATKPHHRSQVSEKNLEQRSSDRSLNSSTNSNSSVSAARASPHSNSSNSAPSEVVSHSASYSRTRNEGPTTSNHSQVHSHSHSVSTPSSTSHIEDGPNPAPSSAKSEQMTGQKRGGNFRRRRNDDNTRGSRLHQNHQNKDGKAQHELSFELEPLSFPPLPGQLGNSSSSDTPEGNKLSDVVKGTARPCSQLHARVEKEPKSAPLMTLTPSVSQCVTHVPNQTSISAHSSSDPVVSQVTIASVSSAPLHSSAAVVSANSLVGTKETPEPSGVPASSMKSSTTSIIVTPEPSTQPKASKACSGASGTVKPSTEANTVSKQTALDNSSVKHTPSPVIQNVPARLSYAQMVQRRQATENVEKQRTDDSLQPAASASVTRPAAQTTLREQSQTQTVNAVSASATPKSACASARSSNKESVRKDFEPREQRFQGSRRSKENRDRQQRPERRRSERDVRVVAK